MTAGTYKTWLNGPGIGALGLGRSADEGQRAHGIQREIGERGDRLRLGEAERGHDAQHRGAGDDAEIARALGRAGALARRDPLRRRDLRLHVLLPRVTGRMLRGRRLGAVNLTIFRAGNAAYLSKTLAARSGEAAL